MGVFQDGSEGLQAPSRLTSALESRNKTHLTEQIRTFLTGSHEHPFNAAARQVFLDTSTLTEQSERAAEFFSPLTRKSLKSHISEPKRS